MSDTPARKSESHTLPCMESLENRLLLTTLNGGEFFLYQNTEGETVRVDLQGQGSVELMSYNPNTGDVTDLVGLLGGDFGAPVNWFDGQEILDSTDGLKWKDYKQGSDTEPPERGARTELYAIYVNEAGPSTTLTLSTLAGDPFEANDWDTAIGNLAPYASTNLPVFERNNEGAATVRAPEGSGGVIVGSATMDIDGDPTKTYLAMTDHAPIAASELGVFPGGDLVPGITIGLDADDEPQDMNAIWVGGTVAGTIGGPYDAANESSVMTGGIRTVDMGYLAGRVLIGGNTEAVVLRQGSHDGIEDSRIAIGGSAGLIDVRGGTLRAAIEVETDNAIAEPSGPITELEGLLWDYTNDDNASAQIVGRPSNELTIHGSGVDDTYALPMKAGQTVTINGGLEWLFDKSELEFVDTFLSDASPIVAVLYDADGIRQGSVGYESKTDRGIFRWQGEQKELTFTAPEAGVYYIKMENKPWATGGGDYTLFVDGAAPVNLAGVNVNGEYAPTSVGTGVAASEDDGGTPTNLAVKGGGTLGAVTVSGNIAGSIRAFDGSIYAVLSGGLTGEVSVDRWLGSVKTTADGIAGKIYAGGHDRDDIEESDYENAYIQNISSAGDLAGEVRTSGSIGTIFIGGTYREGSIIRVNYDAKGKPGTVDLLDIEGDFGSLDGMPSLYHGVGGNFGDVNVGGTIYKRSGIWISEATPVTYTDGRTVVLNDDGGGTLTVRPQLNGDGDDATMTTVSFVYIPVDDWTGGVGGVIANLTLDGSADLTVSGDVSISELTIQNAPADTEIDIDGAGSVRIYHVQADSAIESFVNNTGGDLISGAFQGVNLLEVGGSIGPAAGRQGQWLHGNIDAPDVGNNTTEPQFGWYDGRINGIQVEGDLGELNVGGKLGDLRVTGQAGVITVNADGRRKSGQWEGVMGLVWTQNGIDEIYVGDGLADDGGADRPVAGIFSTGHIGGVYIEGPYDERDGRQFGQLNGSILGSSIGEVIGTDGARLSAIVAGAELDWFLVTKFDSFMHTGAIDLIDFSGAGSGIDYSMIAGTTIGSVLTSEDSQGIQHTNISANRPQPNMPVIEEIVGGGVGLYDVVVDVQGGSIGSVRSVGPEADIDWCSFYSADGMEELISARDIVDIDMHMPGTVGVVSAVRDIIGTSIFDNTSRVGAIGTVTAGRDFKNVSYFVAGEIGSLRVNRDFVDSYLTLQGPAVANLQSMWVQGDISGEIVCAGHIGAIVSNTGAITASIRTLENEWDTDVDSISTTQPFTGMLDLAGDLNAFTVGGPLGENPAEFGGMTQTLSIAGNLSNMSVDGNLFANLMVGGDIVSLAVDGTIYGQVATNADLRSMSVTGDIGGDIGGGLGVRGGLTVLGDLQNLTLNNGQDIVTDLTVRGNIDNLVLQGGSILGDVESVFGIIKNIAVSGGGNIVGFVNAPEIWTISLTGGDLDGNVTAGVGGIWELAVSGGDIDADVTTTGHLRTLRLSGGDLAAGRRVSAEAGIGGVQVTGGNVLGQVTTERGLGSLSIQNGDLRGNVNADTGIGSLGVSGEVNGSTVRSGHTIDSIAAGLLNGAVFSSASNVGAINVDGNMTNSMILAGYDVGQDLALGGGDDNALSGGVPNSGSIGSLEVLGDFGGSVVTAGMGPGADMDFATMGDNEQSGGFSEIASASVRGAFQALGQTNVVAAESAIDSRFLATAPLGVAMIPPSQVTDIAGNDFGPDAGQESRTFAGGLTLSLTGAGLATYNPATGELVLNGTTDQSVLRLTYNGVDPFDTPIAITGSDNVHLGAVIVEGDIVVGDIDFDGAIGSLTLGAVESGATWTFHGHVGSLTVEGPANLTVNAATIDSFVFNGDYTGGGFTADAVGTLRVNGMMAADVDVLLDGIGTYRVTGEQIGNVTVRQTVGTFRVDGLFQSALAVTHGDLNSLTLQGGMLNGATVTVERGAIGQAYIGGGDFAGTVEVAKGIGTFESAGGDFAGILTTGLGVGTLRTQNAFIGEAHIGGPVANVVIGSMDGGVLTANGDILSVWNWGDMINSRILAGYDNANDRAADGRIDTVTIKGAMRASTITAGVHAGDDGFFGTGDDSVAASGTIGTVIVDGDITGTADPDASYGVYAANNMPTVTFNGGQDFERSGNARVDSLRGPASGLAVERLVDSTKNSLTVFFNHDVDTSTITDASFRLVASQDDDFTTEGDNTDISATAPHRFVFDSETHSVTFLLTGATWNALAAGDHYFLILDGSVVADNRGNPLDGNGDGAGGDDLFAHYAMNDEGDFELVENQLPFADVSDRTIPHTQDTIVIDMPATDPDGQTVTYTAAAESASPNYQALQQFGLISYNPQFDNWAGHNEKWLVGDDGWYYILPNGELYDYNPLHKVAELDADAWADPVTEILNALPSGGSDATVTVNGNEIAIDPADGFVGAFTVYVTASDGVDVVRGSFDVTVTNSAPELDLDDVTIPHTQDTIELNLPLVDNDLEMLDYTAEVLGSAAAFDLKQQLGLTAYEPSFDNWAGLNEKWLKGDAGWYFIEPDGTVKEYPSQDAVGKLGAEAYDDPVANIVNADPGAAVDIPITVNGGQIVIDPPANYSGAFDVKVTASDGAATVEDTFRVTVENEAPELDIPDQAMSHTDDTLTIDLPATDADGDAVQYEAEAIDTPAAFALKQQFGLMDYEPRYDNWAGQNEKWLMGDAGWYYITPDGSLFSYPDNQQVGQLDPAAHANPVGEVLGAVQGPGVDIDVTVNGNRIVIDPPADYTGSFQVKVTATDGVVDVEDTFRVTVENHAPELDIADRKISHTVDTLVVNLPATDADGDPVQYAAEAVTTPAAYTLKQQLGLSDYEPTYDNWAGQNEKWLMGDAGWYYITPNGSLFSYPDNQQVGQLDAAAYANPVGDILGAVQGAGGDIDVTVNGNQIVVDPPAGYTGTFQVRVTATDGAVTVEDTFQVTVTNLAPELNIADRTMPAGQDTLQLNLADIDGDGEQIFYGAHVVTTPQAVSLRQQLGLYEYEPMYDNWMGLNEKWLKGDDGWYYIAPNGKVFSYPNNTEVGQLDDAAFANPVGNILHAVEGVNDDIDVTVNGSQIVIDPPDGYTGKFDVIVTATDGVNDVSDRFTVTVE